MDPWGLKWQDSIANVVSGKAVKPIVAKYVDSPSGQRIITAGISGAAGGAVLGAVTGSSAGGIGALPASVVGAITGSSINMLKQTIKEATGFQEASDELVEDIIDNLPGAKTNTCHDR